MYETFDIAKSASNEDIIKMVEESKYKPFDTELDYESIEYIDNSKTEITINGEHIKDGFYEYTS